MRCIALAAAAALAVTAAACVPDTDSSITGPVEAPSAYSVQDDAQRVHMSPTALIAALRTPGLTNGTVLVGLKEGLAVRGVGRNGIQLPVYARLAAVAAVRRDFPELQVVRDVARVGRFHTNFGAVQYDTSFVTWVTVRAPLDEEVLTSLKRHPNVDYVVPNYSNGVIFGETTPWGVTLVRAAQAWAAGYNGGPITVGMVDTGIDSNGYTPGSDNLHPDFGEGRVIFRNPAHDNPDNTCGVSTGATSAMPCYWEQVYHGTGVLGAMLGKQNGSGSVGVAPGVGSGYHIEVAKVLYRLSNGDYGMTQDDFAWAVLQMGYGSTWYDPRARIAVTSVGYRSTSPEGFDALWDAFRTSYNQHGVLWFVAAGNTGGGSVTVPALFPEVIAVSSVESNGSWSSFSAQDDEVELSAPGGTQWLSWNRRDDVSNSLMRDVQGTSFAAPMAAGVARLALHKYPSWTASQLRENMRLYARDRGTPGWDRYYGYGQVDAVCLLNMTAPCNP